MHGFSWENKMPHAEKGNVVGLFGGSFNPPHDGHALVGLTAIRRLHLNQLWWMVTPGNPLKDKTILSPLHERMAKSAEIIPHPKARITGFENTLNSANSVDTVSYILKHNPGVHFIWIMGADSLSSFHLWHQWQDIVQLIPIAIIDRPSARMAALSSPMAQTYRRYQLDERDAGKLSFSKAPAWVYLHGPRSSASSTNLREKLKG